MCKLKLCGHPLVFILQGSDICFALFIADGPFSHRLISSLLWTGPTSRTHTCVFTSHLFVVICQVRWQNSLTLHASHIWQPKGNAQVEYSNTINWLIATYFLFLLTNKLADFLLPINYLQEDGKSNACEVLKLIFLTYIDTLLQCVTKASLRFPQKLPLQSRSHIYNGNASLFPR